MTAIRAPEWPRCSRCGKPSHPDHRQELHGRLFCSASCVEAEQEGEKAASFERLRALVLERDRGQCARCPINAVELREHLNQAMERLKPARPNDPEWRKALGRWEARRDGFDKRGFDRHAIESGAVLWECAHVVARVDGGRDELSNLITLCLECHKTDSAKLARSRADRRRPLRGRR